MKIGILLIATGKYSVFVEPLKASLDEFFLTGHDKTIYLFTDKPKEGEFYIPHEKWPGPTLHRYKHFVQYHQAIDADYLFYMDVDMRVVAPVGDEILRDLVAVQHPGFWKGGWGDQHTPKTSLAYVPVNERKTYYAGGFQGGSYNSYMMAASSMALAIMADTRKGITAHWHDESHWNKYLTRHPFTELSPSYCFPEAVWAKDLPFAPRIKALDKDHKALRS